MYGEQLLEHFRNPRNIGELDEPAAKVEVTNPACGDILRLSALMENGKAVQVRYKTRGCTASIAAGSALTELLVGKTTAEMLALSTADVERAVGGLSSASRHAAVLCVDATRALVHAISQSCGA